MSLDLEAADIRGLHRIADAITKGQHHHECNSDEGEVTGECRACDDECELRIIADKICRLLRMDPAEFP